MKLPHLKNAMPHLKTNKQTSTNKSTKIELEITAIYKIAKGQF